MPNLVQIVNLFCYVIINVDFNNLFNIKYMYVFYTCFQLPKLCLHEVVIFLYSIKFLSALTL